MVTILPPIANSEERSWARDAPKGGFFLKINFTDFSGRCLAKRGFFRLSLRRVVICDVNPLGEIRCSFPKSIT